MSEIKPRVDGGTDHVHDFSRIEYCEKCDTERDLCSVCGIDENGYLHEQQLAALRAALAGRDKEIKRLKKSRRAAWQRLAGWSEANTVDAECEAVSGAMDILEESEGR